LPSATKASVSATKYTVQAGDTLYSIAQQYGLSVDELMALNGITDPSSLTVGQVLIIAEGSPEEPTVAPTPGGTGDGTVHVVQRGENLFRIALRYGTTVQVLASYNNIVNPSLIYVGQKIAIPPGSTDPGSSTGRVHVVQPGENLYRIALRYNTTPWAIAVANGLSNTSLIYVGQRLRIP
jgi:LysM repeat protein